MQLKKLKLAGFKSFVDPTTVIFPSHLVGVVGPNGCGKSNIIDAVRWVMGESSAKNLRGESMTDVIFNGSTDRKPVGQASVELVFENTLGKIGGEYAKYNEISIRRVVTRDAQSNYYLNNTKCRRKDIADVFLGTGLGPRSYSIIEQGMISRFIEAKPEELRKFLEEAAGISKYKERRRETENRMRHTRENLERINDIREELHKQLDRLNRQAQAAQKYKTYREEERVLKGQLLVLKMQAIQEQLTTLEDSATQKTVALEACIAKQRHVDAALEEHKQQRTEANDSFNQCQQVYYATGAQIARLEAAIAHQRERREQLAAELAQSQAELQALLADHGEDAAKLEVLLEQVANDQPQLDILIEQHAHAKELLVDAEVELEAWQQSWEQFTEAAHEISKKAHGEQTRIQGIENQLRDAKQRLEKLQEDFQKITPERFTQELAELQARVETLGLQKSTNSEALDLLSEKLNSGRSTLKETQQKLNAERETLQTNQAEYASLKAVQQAALGKQSSSVMGWLENNTLSNAPRLGEGIRINPGWEKALETVLGQTLQAVCVDDLTTVVSQLDALTEGQCQFFLNRASLNPQAANLTTTLASQVQSDWSGVTDLLNGIYLADDLNQALHLQNKLATHESIVTRDGLWIGPQWLRVARDEDIHHGILSREKQLSALEQTMNVLQKNCESLDDTLSTELASISAYEEERESLQANIARVHQAHSEALAQVRIIENQKRQAQERSEKISQDMQAISAGVSEQQETLNLARQVWQAAMEGMASDSEKRAQLTEQKAAIHTRLENIREQTYSQRENIHDLEVSTAAANTQIDSLRSSIARQDERIDTLNARIEGVALAQAQANNPDSNLDNELEGLLTQHNQQEVRVSEARTRLETIESAISDAEQMRHRLEEEGRGIQQLLEQSRLDAQTHKVRLTTLEESLDEAEQVYETVCEAMPADAKMNDWEQKLEQLTNRISRLGAINLAAIEEYETESERKVYLDAQFEDLNQALNTLENAIGKIDKETRVRFRETFDTVNDSFKQLFPRIFGGGRAYLELTDEHDLLATGVGVMAQPPGKRNSSIHLLSGGEKAMTAVSLVFAIFQLNPSPFCMLDEVDAPLDDANVGRFCKLVKEMSSQVQFIIITHNKVTMELAQHLSGVTMAEPGVSRLVSVDVDEAVALTEA